MLTNAARVLIADGDLELRRTLYRKLLDLDVFSDSVGDGRAALERLQGRPYGMLILDLGIDQVDAIRIIDFIAEMLPERRPMVLAMTAGEARPALDSDLVQIVLRKPLEVDEIAEIVRSCLASVAEPERARERGDATLTRKRKAEPA
jgi:CheY-like chemotaxis protein